MDFSWGKLIKLFNEDKRKTSTVYHKHDYLLRSRSCVAEADGFRRGNQRRPGLYQCHQKRSASSFSDLPDEVAHHILSFLPIKDVVRLSCVSKRCRKLCLSTRSFKFEGFSNASISTCHQRRMLLKSLDELLVKSEYRRDRYAKIQSFRFEWTDDYQDGKLCCYDKLNDWMRRWIQIATSCNVEVLDLRISIPALPEYYWEFPSDSVFGCVSIRLLSLRRMFTVVKPPSIDCTSNLECLKLDNVDILDEEFFKWISSCCKCLKELTLMEVSGFNNCTIESSSLKSLTIVCGLVFYDLNISCEKLESIYLNSGLGCLSSPYWLSISAPNLKSLTWLGNNWNCQNLGKFLSLEKATIGLVRDGVWTDNAWNIACKLFSSMRRVKFLNLINKEVMMFLFKEGFKPALPLASHLRISLLSLKDETVPAMVSLLKGMPHLSALHIEANSSEPCSESNSSAFHMQYWRSQKLEFIDHLREVSIGISGGSNGITFVRYILENARHLEKMVILIHHLAEQSYTVRELKRRMVSNAEVVFQQIK